MKRFNFFNNNDSYFNRFLSLKMKEGLTFSVEYEFFVKKIINFLNTYDCNYDIKIDNFVELSINIDNIDKKKFNSKLTDLLNNLGYEKARVVDIDGEKTIKSILLSNNKNFLIFFQKRFDLIGENPSELYHSTTEYYYNKIKNKGLVTKKQNMVSEDLERIYLTDNLSESLDFCTQKRFFYKNKYRNTDLFNMDIDKWVILEIDFKSIPDFKLRIDTKMDNSYYTYSYIPPYAIKIIDKLNFHNN